MLNGRDGDKKLWSLKEAPAGSYQRLNYSAGSIIIRSLLAQMRKNEQQATIRARNQLLSCIENFHQTCFKQNWIILRWNKYNTSKAHKWWQVGIRSKCITVPNKSKCLCVFFLVLFVVIFFCICFFFISTNY